MSDFDLLIRGDRDIGISDGKFVAIGANLAGSAREEIDATGMQLFPGVIDSHVHFNEPGRTEWEGFSTGSRAAAAGGTTMVFDMPLNAHPPTIDGASFDQKRSAAEASSLVDFALWGGLVPGNLDQLPVLHDRGVVGLKAFMCNSGIDDFPWCDNETLFSGMQRAAKLGMLVAVHAESEEITRKLSQEKNALGRATVRDYLDSRPVEAELDAIGRAIELAGEARCRLHIVHVTCGSGVGMIAQARAKGVDVTCETCPHYLLLTDKDMERLGPVAKCAPPLRSEKDQAELRAMLGKITTTGSDHSPSEWVWKNRENFFDVWGGISGCQHLLPLLIDLEQRTPGLLPFELISRLTSTQVAKRFGILEKGEIAIGKDADFTLVDLTTEESIHPESLHYRNRHSPYVGLRLRARVVRTVLRGQTLFLHGKVADSALGRFVRPQNV